MYFFNKLLVNGRTEIMLSIHNSRVINVITSSNSANKMQSAREDEQKNVLASKSEFDFLFSADDSSSASSHCCQQMRIRSRKEKEGEGEGETNCIQISSI